MRKGRVNCTAAIVVIAPYFARACAQTFERFSKRLRKSIGAIILFEVNNTIDPFDLIVPIIVERLTAKQALGAMPSDLHIVNTELLVQDFPAENRMSVLHTEVRNAPYLRLGWARVVLGLYTGLCYLQDRFGLNADNVWNSVNAVENARDVET